MKYIIKKILQISIILILSIIEIYLYKIFGWFSLIILGVILFFLLGSIFILYIFFGIIITILFGKMPEKPIISEEQMQRENYENLKKIAESIEKKEL